MTDISLYLKAKKAYYSGDPIMSDAQFDALEDQIRTESPNEPALKLIGAPPSDDNRKRPHLIHMGSQEKVNSFEELVRWESLRANKSFAKFHASLKADGGSVALYYIKGELVAAMTRGDGEFGEDIFFQTHLFKGVPQRLPEPISIGVRCEAVMTLEDWKLEDPDLTSNPRNIATGILGRLDTLKSHRITLLAFDVDPLAECEFAWKPFGPGSESSRFRFLNGMGFQTTEWFGNASLAEVQTFFEEIKAKRDSDALPYWIDGVVVRYEDRQLQADLNDGDSKKPKGQVAWKFPAEGASTFLRSVEWQVGHTGALAPVAHIDPVRIGGTTVSRASLANADNIRTLGAWIGAPVTVQKRGDIIPMIVSVDGTAKIMPSVEIPCKCPICAAPVEKRKNTDGSLSVALFCTGDDCDSQVTGRIRRFVASRDIQGLGKSIIASLVDSGKVSNVSDLFDLKPESIFDLVMKSEKDRGGVRAGWLNEDAGVRLGEKRATAICEEIALKTQTMTLSEFLGAFGTRGLGVRRAQLMTEANPTLEEFEKWFDGSLLNKKFATAAGVPNMGQTIFEGLKERETIIRKTLEHVKLVKSVEEVVTGLVICITGSLPSGKKKKDYAGPLSAKGHKLVDDLTKDVNVLVMADPTGPESGKTKKAKKLGIKLWSELEMMELLK